ncbi:DUF1345 domain-containing protein [Phyllobacterium zundukense]|uniref:DUF1345 domain-containing protein n=1 Tax=Phyllobacterium zundukense TaxID=1867719 RepID=A0A2N9VU58_9HYPH|nr:DUF1345 domain-containing protein [Phyllobacterium zundukense]ATU93029.1 hypothetical protein BLM14_16465 [Phyllobacterium zundukense]PIO43026.1 hypothetical protein B5P45_21630 [Phyllobacterium zundukense]
MWKRHNPFYLAAIIGLATLALALAFAPHVAYAAAANAFFVVYLTLSAIKVRKLTPEYLRKNAARSDEPVWIIFAVTFGAVVVAVGSLFVLLNSGQNPQPFDLSLALAAVFLGWMTIHMMAAIHYAHLYWQPDEDAEGTKDKPREHVGGLDFPGGKEPGGIEFLYFSYVIGMTAQTSDTAITSTDMRKINLLHAIISFFFNTVLVAAAVNVAVSLGQ